jgi:hypothetical protein
LREHYSVDGQWKDELELKSGGGDLTFRSFSLASSTLSALISCCAFSSFAVNFSTVAVVLDDDGWVDAITFCLLLDARQTVGAQ